jgi:hypothetical protein
MESKDTKTVHVTANQILKRINALKVQQENLFSGYRYTKTFDYIDAEGEREKNFPEFRDFVALENEFRKITNKITFLKHRLNEFNNEEGIDVMLVQLASYTSHIRVVKDFATLKQITRKITNGNAGTYTTVTEAIFNVQDAKDIVALYQKHTSELQVRVDEINATKLIEIYENLMFDEADYKDETDEIAHFYDEEDLDTI